ncbi:MAG: OB-fold nucleic acid binding domain-containing protein, partial [Bacteroidales bacterium]|nr:OB-fold nucleic acid binding domain-containing protein [Bacteroidales bacterium]
MENTHLSEQEQIRRNALKEIENLGIDPYPAAEYPVDTTAEEILSGFDAEKNNYPNVTVAGRIMSRRIMGAASFMVIQDHTGRIQVYLKRDDICPTEDKTLYNTVFKKLLDIGDIVGVKGYTFITQTGELTIHAKEFTLLSKSLRVLPIVKEKEGQTYDAFTDPEQRYRMRYLDLIVNPQVRD